MRPREALEGPGMPCEALRALGARIYRMMGTAKRFSFGFINEVDPIPEQGVLGRVFKIGPAFEVSRGIEDVARGCHKDAQTS